ncbi:MULTISPECIES: Lrp/AsnC family transcriptional regulator [Agrobacterium]|uniref:Lrp/AsnC family transcriptional regulator n=1 Tax=Agrobacterium pusense TaxID=648995 RepID=A0A6H0ZFS6_9HYPH|nr:MULTISPECIES: Lrp/AsnC family transcriptional regulator [Agrobacterium]QCM14059.1 Lrp/AsnC family transcriptional regulator [Agrobacterium tumefaciens]QIX19702.1 Lrp/AsnC family transcriptional regulator [Agrobacterium pusense]RAL96928.1 Lrp/AsnC family transcriptional regulator [Agrobacterium sp. MS2]WCK27460.1 Lrp/AsnC family transcriptional regulator [Agrobacterium pusense]
MAQSLDRIDRAILRILQSDGRLLNTELADRVGLSPSPCLRRVKSLEESGVIDRYVALVDPAKVGMGFSVFARVWLSGQDEETVDGFVEAVQKLPQIVECQLMAGDCDFILRVIAPDLEGYRKFQTEHLGRIRNVRNIKTEIPMQKIKLTTEIPI